MFRPEQLFQSSMMALKVRFLPRLDLCLECFMGSLSALCEFTHHSISRLQRKSSMTGRTAASRRVGQWPVWAVRVGDGAPIT